MRSRPILRQVTCVECNSIVQVRGYDKCPHCDGWLADLACTYLEGPFAGEFRPASTKTPGEKVRSTHEARLRRLGIPVDLNGRSGYLINDPRLDEMEKSDSKNLVSSLSRDELAQYCLELANGQWEMP